MKNRLLYITIVCLFILQTSCTKDESTAGDSSCFCLNTSIIPHIATRNVVSGSNFPQNTTMGLFVCRHEEGTPTQFVEYNSKYNNIYAIQTSSDAANPVWNYKYLGTGSQFSNLFLLRPQTGEQAADFYAYAPWISGVTNPTSIPFNLSQNDYRYLPDLMYASENNTTTNKNKTPEGSDIPVYFHFVHKLVWLQVKFYLNNDDGDGSLGPSSTNDSYNKSTINSIVLRKKSAGTTALYGSGVFNAITGTFGTTIAADSIKVSYGYTFGTKGNNYNLLLYPTTYLADGDYELVFTIDGKQLETTYPIQLTDVTHTDSSVGFSEGYRYTFTFTYDNYHHIRLLNTQIDDDSDWQDFPQQKEIII